MDMNTSCETTPTKLIKMEFDLCDEEDVSFRQKLSKMRETETFCDATICIPDENKRVPVHRAVMSSCSDFFRSVFTNGFKETQQNEVILHDVSAATIQVIIDYAYTKQLNVDQDNVEDVVIAADRLGILSLLQECIEFLSNQLTPHNCIGIWQLAKFYNWTSLQEICWVFMMKNILKIARGEEFVHLQIQEILDILQDDTLDVREEDDLIDVLMRWVDFSKKERKQYLDCLIRSVRLPFVSVEGFQRKILPRKDFKRCSSMVTIRGLFHLVKDLCPSDNRQRRSNKSKLTKYANPRIPSNLIFVVGGWARQGVTESVETYDRNTDQWFEVRDCQLRTPRAYHATVPMLDKIYVIGGFNGSHYLNSFIAFDVSIKKWEERAPMYMSRCYVSAADVGGAIYACGGFDGRQRHNSVERYDSSKNQWTLVRPMSHQRSDAGAAHHQGKLYVCGGFDGHSCLFSAEVYDPDTNQWTMLTPMSTRRSGVSLAVCSGRLYAIGGYDGARRLDTVECLNIPERQWYAAPSMVLGRSNFCCVVMDGIIYVMGGYDGDTTSHQVEYFSPTTRVWRVLNDLNLGRSAVSACAVRDVFNVRDFTFHGNGSTKLACRAGTGLRGPTTGEKNKEYAKWMAVWRQSATEK